MRFPDKLIVAVSLVILLLPAAAGLQAQPAPAGEIQQALLKLNELGSVLTIAAHPDDERSELLAYFSQGRHMRAAYLSVTRGEGGQNVLGPEQGAALGLIRTQELLDARRIDGAEQFFTRAIDFGFSKTPNEAIAKWGHDAVLSDMVWVIRRYRPDVVILGFSGTPADGHGHHQASALLGKEAYEAAGDPARFPEQLRYVQPWKAAKLVRAGGFFGGRGGQAAAAPPIAPVAEIDTSGYNSILGYSYAQLATISRSQHRSQGLGAMGVGGGMGGGRGGAPFGPAAAQEAPATPSPDVFAGIEHSWKRLPGGSAIDAIFSQAIREFDWQHPDATIPLLAKARPLIAAISDPLASLKLAELDETIARCAGIWADAQAREGNVTPGSHVAVAMTVVARAPVATRVQSIVAENVWAGKPWTPADAAASQRIPDYDLEVPAAQPYSQPYWLVKPPDAGAYQVDNQLLVGLPESPVERMRIRLTVAGTPIELVRPVLYRYNDRLEGEKVRPLTVVPPVAVNLPTSPDNIAEPGFAVPHPRRSQPARDGEGPGGQRRGEPAPGVPAGWKAEPRAQPFRLAAIDDLQELIFQVTPPAGEGTATLHAIATVAGKQIAVGHGVHLLFPYSPANPLSAFGCQADPLGYQCHREARRLHHGRGRRSARRIAPDRPGSYASGRRGFARRGPFQVRRDRRRRARLQCPRGPARPSVPPARLREQRRHVCGSERTRKRSEHRAVPLHDLHRQHRAGHGGGVPGRLHSPRQPSAREA